MVYLIFKLKVSPFLPSFFASIFISFSANLGEYSIRRKSAKLL